MNKKMLIVYPNNFLQGMQGTNSRVFQLVKLFKEIGYEIDFFGYENFTSDSSFKDFEKLNTDNLISNLYVYDFQQPKKNKKEFIIKKLKRKFNKDKKNYLQDWTNPDIQEMFDDITSKNNYDIVILFYTYLANLIKNSNQNYKKVYFMEDSMFLQQYSWDKNNNKNLTLGKLIDEEIERLKYFDEYFCISYDEKIFYEKLIERKMNFLPHVSSNFGKELELKPLSKRKWDVFFIGFNNPFNVEGLNWFLSEVYPYLDKNLKILLVGSATKKINISYPNVDIIQFVPDLDDVFKNVKVSICPMFRGTGMKIKVVESMEKGIPVVCNEKGVDGLPDKTECGCLVTEDAKEFADYINKLIENESFYNEISQKIKNYYNKIFDREKYKNKIKDLWF
jgi:glycosyltransferase, family 1